MLCQSERDASQLGQTTLSGAKDLSPPALRGSAFLQHHAVKRRALRRTSRSSTEQVQRTSTVSCMGSGVLRLLFHPLCLARDREIRQQDRMDDYFALGLLG